MPMMLPPPDPTSCARVSRNCACEVVLWKPYWPYNSTMLSTSTQGAIMTNISMDLTSLKWKNRVCEPRLALYTSW